MSTPLDQILAKLKTKIGENEEHKLSLVSRPSKTEVDCRICNDMGVIIYRVHKDTQWDTVLVDREAGKVETQIPRAMELESTFYEGKLCEPADAKDWADTYSKRCSCIEQKKLSRLLKSSEITEHFQAKGFQNFQKDGKHPLISEAFDLSRRYYREYKSIQNGRQNSIALLGQPGAGKTHLLMAVANNLLKKDLVPVQYFPYVEGFSDLKSDFADGALERKLERLKKVAVLFIDDLFKPAGGKPKASQWEIETTLLGDQLSLPKLQTDHDFV